MTLTPATTAEARDRGRELFGLRSWGDAYAALSAADAAAPLEGEDLERLATAAHLLGRDPERADAWARAYHAFLSRGDAPRAARCAYWLGIGLIFQGDLAQGGGWLARARRLLDDGQHDCPERGYLLLPAALERVGARDFAAAHEYFDQAATIGERFGDADLVMLARQGQGRSLIQLGRTAEGVALLDEVMVAATSDEVSPVVVGIVYCSVIDACQDIYDLRRAHEWTTALDRWCAAQPDLVPYRGHCLVNRAEILRLHGAWPDALDEARRAGERLSQPYAQRAAGAAFYQQAELHRLRGEFAGAEAAYRRASECGRTPEPGLALLRLAQGKVAAAEAAIRRVAGEAHDRRDRARVLAACVEVMLAAGDVASARAAADELARMATDLDAPFLRALSAHSSGAVLAAEGDARAALGALRQAWSLWHELEAPYEAARVRVLVATACRQLGDDEGWEMEMDAARQAFAQLGAAPDLARVERLARRPRPRRAAELTAREAEVLALVATGRTNRAIAEGLRISEKTVARHVSNIFTKLGLSTRAAAASYAYRHGLVQPPT